MVVTHSEEEWHLIRSLRNQGRPEPGGWLEHVRLGFNYRLSDIAAALGIGQMERFDEILARRSEAAGRYAELLGSVDGLELPCADDADHRRSWFVYVVLFPDSAARERAIAAFEREGIGYNRYLPSIHLQPYMRRALRLRGGPLPGRRGRQLALARASVLHGDRGRPRRSASPRFSRRLCEAAEPRPRRAVHDEGRLDDPGAAPHGGAEPRRGGARARPGHGTPLPRANRGDLLRHEGLGLAGGRRRDAEVRPATRSSSRPAPGTRSRTTARASSSSSACARRRTRTRTRSSSNAAFE